MRDASPICLKRLRSVPNLSMPATDRPRAYLCRRFTPAVEAALRERFMLEVNEDDSILPPAEIARRAQGSGKVWRKETAVVIGERVEFPGGRKPF